MKQGWRAYVIVVHTSNAADSMLVAQPLAAGSHILRALHCVVPQFVQEEHAQEFIRERFEDKLLALKVGPAGTTAPLLEQTRLVCIKNRQPAMPWHLV